MIWRKEDIDKDAVKELSEAYQIDVLSAAILWRRNITSGEEIKFFLENDLSFTHSPFRFIEMEDAVERIRSAIEEKEKIRIFGDRDVDGITSTVMLTEILEEHGANVSWALPQGDDPYGLTKEGLAAFADEGGTLAITVDCGISNQEEISFGTQLGIDTIVVDHHIAPEVLPPAFAIINPKIEDSGYPFRDLAGCGVTAKLIWALLFSRTQFYNQTFCLINAHPGNDSVIIEAVKIMNMVEIDRITENVVPGIVTIDQTRFYPFIEGQELLVYEQDLQNKLLRTAFGKGVDIHVSDLSEEIHKYFPVFKGRSLFGMVERSRIAKYRKERTTELDVLISLFKHYVIAREKDLTSRFHDILDLVSLGTLADMMPLKNENRILVKKGMEVLNSTKRKGLQELFLRQNILSKKLNTTDVGWQISPLINATGRLGQPDIAAQLLLTQDSVQRKELAEKVVTLNNERKKQGEEAWSRIFPKAKKSLEELEGRMIIVEDDVIPRGITGIIAARLVSMFNTTSMVIASLEDKRIGSIRSPGTRNVRELLSMFEDSFIDYGGHAFAAGFSLSHEKFPDFKTKLSDYIQHSDYSAAPEDVLSVDAELPPEYMNPQLIELVEKFEPYGEDSPPLQFLIRNMKILSIDLLGKKEIQHVKMLLEYGKYKWPGLLWNGSPRVNRDFSLGDSVDIVFRLNRNYYLNKETLQLTLLDVRKTC